MLDAHLGKAGKEVTALLHDDADEDTPIGVKVKRVELERRVLGMLSRASCEAGCPTDGNQAKNRTHIKARIRSLVAEANILEAGVDGETQH